MYNLLFKSNLLIKKNLIRNNKKKTKANFVNTLSKLHAKRFNLISLIRQCIINVN